MVFAPGATTLVGWAQPLITALLEKNFWVFFSSSRAWHSLSAEPHLTSSLSFSLFIKTLSRMWFLWPHFCLIRCGLYLKAVQKWVSSYPESFYLGLVGFFYLAGCPMWWCPLERIMLLQFKNSLCFQGGHRGQLVQLKWWLLKSCLIKSSVTCWTRVNDHEIHR